MITLLPGALPMPAAVAALRASLLAGLDPEAGTARSAVPLTHGQMLLMPAEWGAYTGVKVATVAPANPAQGLPRIHGNYLLFDAATLAPLALLDGVELTNVRTAAVSALAVDALAAPDAGRLLVFGTGPQARAHVEAVRCVREVREVTVVARDPDRTRLFAAEVGARVGSVADVESADIVVCCTTARTPLFDGSLLSPNSTVVAVGSHEPDAREVDDTTVLRSTVVVETVATALREAGDVILAGADPAALIPLADLVRGEARLAPDRPRLFKSVGMAWEDLVLAAAHFEAAGVR